MKTTRTKVPYLCHDKHVLTKISCEAHHKLELSSKTKKSNQKDTETLLNRDKNGGIE